MEPEQDNDDVSQRTQDQSNSSTTSVIAPSSTNSEITGAKNVLEANAIAAASATSRNCVLVNSRQRGNPVLKFIRNVAWEYSTDIIPDYVFGTTSCALFLSVRYHNLHPDYIHERLKDLKRAFILRVLLVQVDVSDPYPILKSLTHISLLADLTLIPTNSAEEAGRIIENYKMFENKPVDAIKEQKDPGLLQQVMDALISIRSVNKTDAMTLLNVFGSVAHLLKADLETISLCPGIGPKKAQLIYLSLREKFKLST